jgi:AcrR family transcriptional regulator
MTELLDELPYEQITVEAVAERAGVSKQTIYRWWSGKHELAMESYERAVRERVAIPDTGTLAGDLHAFMRGTCEALRVGGGTVAGLIAAAQSDPALADAFRVTLIGARRKIMSGLLQRGITRGELPRTVDLPLAMDLLYGPVWYRLLLRNAPLDDAFADAIVERFLRAFI